MTKQGILSHTERYTTYSKYDFWDFQNFHFVSHTENSINVNLEHCSNNFHSIPLNHLHVYMHIVVMLMMVMMCRLVAWHYWLWTHILVCKQFFQGSDHIWRWERILGCWWWWRRLWLSWTIKSIWCAENQQFHEPKINYVITNTQEHQI